MSEPTKENPKTLKRSKRKPAMEPLGWDEIVSQPGMGGYLAFLNGPIPLPHLQAAAASGAVAAPGIVATPVVDSPAGSDIASLTTVPVTDSAPAPESIPEASSAPVSITPVTPVVDSATEVVTPTDAPPDPGVVSAYGSKLASTPEVVLIPAIPATGRLRIRRCAATHDGHSLGEEVLYQALWKAAAVESAETRTVVIGWRGMSQLCRMTPKNCKINTQRLIRKLALEVLSPYNTPESIGTTYRVYSDDAILRRRRNAGLEWVVRSRGVEFVDPTTGIAVTAHLCDYVSE